MKIRPIAKSLGAEVINAQLVNMNEKTFSSVEKAFSRYLVLCFRDQRLKPSDLTNLAKKFGGVGDTPYLAGLKDYPDVVPILKEANERSHHTFGSGWHTDFTFQRKPPARTLLYAWTCRQKAATRFLQTSRTLTSPCLSVCRRAYVGFEHYIAQFGPTALMPN